MSPLALLSGLATGLMLGLFGSGGSIITLPALKYLLGMETKAAIAASLVIVGITAGISSFRNWREGNINIGVAIIFAVFGGIGTYAGALIGVITPEIIQLSLFALVMYAAAWRMFYPPKVAPQTVSLVRLDCSGNASLVCFDLPKVGHVAIHGIGVGVLTGMVGVGGGFLIVPALVLLSGLAMKEAVGTSLFIVAVKSFAGFAGYAGKVEMDYSLIGIFTLVAIVGSHLGSMVSKSISAEKLKKSFAIFLLLVASYILVKESLGV